MNPDRERVLAEAVHDLDAAAPLDPAEVAALADQLQIHGMLTAALRERDLATAVAAELRYEGDSPRFAAEVVGRLKGGRFTLFPKIASLAAALCFVALTGWMLFRTPADASRPRALLLVGKLPPGKGDAAVVERLERLGFAVDARTPDAFDPAGRALVAVSSTVLAESMRDVADRLKAGLRDLPIPVIAWEPRLFPELGFVALGEHGTDWAADPQTAVTLEAPGHPLAAGLSGRVEVALPGEQLSWGRVGPGAIRVASLPGAPARCALFAFERGAALDGGLPAPARRVGLFLFDTTAARLTEPGGRLFDAAVLWSIGGTP